METDENMHQDILSQKDEDEADKVSFYVHHSLIDAIR